MAPTSYGPVVRTQLRLPLPFPSSETWPPCTVANRFSYSLSFALPWDQHFAVERRA